MKFVFLTALGAAAALSWAPAQAAPVDLSTMQLNGVASRPGLGVLRLNDGATLADPGNPFSNVGQTSSGFTPQGDGLSFMVQNHADGAGALGGTGGNIGAGGQSISDSLAFDLTSLGSQVYFGFTGATGLSHAVQDVYDWDLSVAARVTGAVPEPASWALMIAGFGGMGAVLRRRRTALVA